MPVRRVAAIDIGSNSVLLLIADSTPTGLRAVVDRCTITRLGRGVDRTRHVSPASLSRTLECVAAYAEEIRRTQVDQVAVVGTSALRDAQGAEELHRTVAEVVGVKLRVIDGLEEAELAFEGAVTALELAETVAVLDVGGGSTEIISGTVRDNRTEIADSISLDIGCVRLTERHLHDDPPTAASIAALRTQARAALGEVAPPPAGCALVGVGGTVTTLVAIERELDAYDGDVVHGARLTGTAVQLLAERLSTVPEATRRRTPGLEPGRADVIVAGSLIVLEALAWAGAGELHVSDRGVRWGLAQRLIQRSA